MPRKESDPYKAIRQILSTDQRERRQKEDEASKINAKLERVASKAVSRYKREVKAARPDAELAETDIKKLGLSPEFAQKVGSFIFLTKHKSVPQDKDQQLLVDIDLAILGRSSRLFDLYEQNVRTEFGWVPQVQFANTRKAILQSFLDRDSIYSTEFSIADMKSKQGKICQDQSGNFLNDGHSMPFSQPILFLNISQGSK